MQILGAVPELMTEQHPCNGLRGWQTWTYLQTITQLSFVAVFTSGLKVKN